MIKKSNKNNLKGICLVVFAGMCWGLSGVTGKYLFREKELTAVWLVTLRLTAGGAMILLLCWHRRKQKIFDIWKQKDTVFDLLIFSIFGMAACQLTYFLAIQHSNPAVATVLHYLAPAFILLFCLAAEKRKPGLVELSVLFMVVCGIFILATHGSLHHLTVTKKALFFGISSAVFLSVYNLQPKKLLNRFMLLEILGWGMMIGGLLLSAAAKIWIVPGIWDYQTAVLALGVVIYGTVIPFYCYLQGVSFLGPVKASMYSSVEPLTAAVFSVMLLGQTLKGTDILGIVCIIGGITVLALVGND